MRTKNLLAVIVAAFGLLLPTALHADPLGDALEAPQLTWITGGEAPWFSQTATTHDGVAAAECGGLTTAYAESWLQTTVTGRVAVLFWWKSVSPGGSAFGFWFQTNGTYLDGLYGNVDWRPTMVSFAGGTNTLQWSSILGGLNPSAPIATNWLDQVVVTNIAGLPPTFLLQPEPTVTIPENYGTSTNLQVRAIGDIPMTYQWQRNGTNLADGGAFSGVTGPTLQVYANITADVGDYRVVLSNTWGMATSQVCSVSVVPAKPRFYSFQPADVVLAPGAFHSFNYVTVFGTSPFQLQWFKDGSPIPYGTISQATFADAGGYYLVATNAYGISTSRVAQVTVSLDLPTIVSGPDPTFIETTAGASGDAFYVSASGPETLSYSWHKVGEATELSAQDYLAFDAVAALDSGFYQVVVANNNGSVTSRVSVLAVAPVTALGLAVNTPHLIVTNHSDWPLWIPDGEGANAHDGLCAARSPVIGDYNAAHFSTTVVGPTNISFWWRISAGAEAFLEVSVDGSVASAISGETAWQQFTFDLPIGEHILTWTFYKNEAGSAGEDAAWVDELTLGTPSSGPTELTNFTTGGASDWFVQTTNTHDGIDAWQSGWLTDAEENWIETTVTGPGTLTFWWAVESEPDLDTLAFLMDGDWQANCSGATDWQLQSFELAAGSHVLRWAYAKDGSLSEGADCGWVDDVIFTPAPPVITLEEALNVTNLIFTTGGDAPWFVESTNSRYGGVVALQSGTIGDNQSSWLRTTVSGPGVLSFWYALSTEVSHDSLVMPWYGDFSSTSGGDYDYWQQQTLNVPAGIHILEWRYEKDASGSAGSDACWVDQVVWSPAANPRVTVTPQWKYPGETCAFSAVVTGEGPFSFQWYREDVSIAGATETNLPSFVATYANVGTYSLVASNSAGYGTNFAKLTVAPLFYELTDLGTLWPGDFTSYANGVNRHGDVAGSCATNSNDRGHAWVWSGGVMTDLGDALGGGDSQAYAINDQGDIVGTARVAGTTNYNAVRWRKVGASYEVDDLGRNGWPYAFAPAMNNAGDIAFSMTDGGRSGNGNRRAYLWRQGNLLPLGELKPTWSEDVGDAYGWGINSLGFIVGTANAVAPPEANSLKRGWIFNGSWRFDPHTAYGLGTLPGVTGTIDSSGVYCVNDYGDLGGHYMHTEWGATGCFVTSGTNSQRVTGWYSYLHGLNNHGDLLANDDGLKLFCSTNVTAPARWPDGRPNYADHALFALEDLVVSGMGDFASIGPSGWTYNQLSEARAIVGTGITTNGASHAFLARPVARPGNHAPVQANALMVTNYANTLIIPIAQLLATCTDADGDPLALMAADGRTSDGSTVRRSGNYLLYTPPQGSYSSPDAILGTVMDYHGGQTPVMLLVMNRPTDMRPPFEGLALTHPTGAPPAVRFFANPGQTWRLEASDTLAPGSWISLVTFLVGPDWTVDFMDAAGLTPPKRFYRAVSP